MQLEQILISLQSQGAMIAVLVKLQRAKICCPGSGGPSEETSPRRDTPFHRYSKQRSSPRSVTRNTFPRAAESPSKSGGASNGISVICAPSDLA